MLCVTLHKFLRESTCFSVAFFQRVRDQRNPFSASCAQATSNDDIGLVLLRFGQRSGAIGSTSRLTTNLSALDPIRVL